MFGYYGGHQRCPIVPGQPSKGTQVGGAGQISAGPEPVRWPGDDRHHGRMTTFDTELVGRWFAYLVEAGPADALDGAIRPTEAERRVLLEGREAITAAVGWSGMPAPAAAPDDGPAGALEAYLNGMATGIAGTRRAMSEAGPDEVEMADRLSLVAGLIAGGAALQVGADGQGGGEAYEPTATDLARVAGTSAAELVVDGADLHTITTAAAAAAMVSGPPDGANLSPRYRTRALVAAVLLALQRSTAPAGAPVEPPSCGARPGVNNGAELLAEITFTAFLSPADTARLELTLATVADEVVVWSEGDRRYFHVHSRAAGEVVAEAYAVGSVFSLEIGRL